MWKGIREEPNLPVERTCRNLTKIAVTTCVPDDKGSPGKTLFFATDRQGGFGLRDIWVTTRIQWG